MLKKMIFLSVSTLIAFLLTAGVNTIKGKSPKTTEYWVYTSTDGSGFATVSGKYQKLMIDDPEDNEYCSVGSSKPCVFIEVTPEIDDAGDFQEYLNDTYGHLSQPARDAAILLNAVSRKN